MKKRKEPLSFFDCIDIPIVAMLVYTIPLITSGALFMIIAPFAEADTNEFISFKALWGAFSLLLIAASIIGIAALYWKLVVKKYGVVFPALTGFGATIAILSLMSGMLTSANYLIKFC